MRRLFVVSMTVLMFALPGCKSAPAPGVKAPVAEPTGGPAPVRPAVPAPAFKVIHHSADSITLVTKEDASDDEIASLIWQLRDAAHARKLDALDKTKVAEKMVEERKPVVWFHIYRGSKCAAEKYASGAPPCGGSYHAAGDYTYGDYVNHEWDNGVLLRGGGEVQLWNPDKPYVAPASGA